MSDVIKNKSRVEYLDIMRILSAFCVIIIHVSASFSVNFPLNGIDWYVTLGDFCRWCVPIFVMISGSLFLDTDYGIRNIYLKKILRIVTALLFWSLIYAFSTVKTIQFDLSLLGAILDGPDHLWFLNMIIGLYMVVPILKEITKSDMLAKYFLLLCFLFAFVVPRMISLYSIYTGREAVIISSKIDNMYLYLPLGYSGYFVLGHYLKTHNVTRTQRYIIYALGLISFIFGLISNIYNQGDNIIKKQLPITYLAPTVLFESVSVFIFNKSRVRPTSKNIRHLIIEVSKCTFGIYLVHILVLNTILKFIEPEKVFGTSLMSVVIISLLVFLVSFLVTYVIRKIPFISKYIV